MKILEINGQNLFLKLGINANSHSVWSFLVQGRQHSILFVAKAKINHFQSGASSLQVVHQNSSDLEP